MWNVFTNKEGWVLFKERFYRIYLNKNANVSSKYRSCHFVSKFSPFLTHIINTKSTWTNCLDFYCSSDIENKNIIYWSLLDETEIRFLSFFVVCPCQTCLPRLVPSTHWYFGCRERSAMALPAPKLNNEWVAKLPGQSFKDKPLRTWQIFQCPLIVVCISRSGNGLSIVSMQVERREIQWRYWLQSAAGYFITAGY